MTSPVLFPQLLRVKVMTAATSVSESCLPSGAIAVPRLPCSTSSLCRPLRPVARVRPDAGSRHHAGGQDVVGGEEHAHLLAHGHDHVVVHFEEIVLALGSVPRDLGLRGGEIRKERYALALALQVVVAPFPLIAG